MTRTIAGPKAAAPTVLHHTSVTPIGNDYLIPTQAKRNLSSRSGIGGVLSGGWLGRVYRGWLNYFAVPGSGRFIRAFRRRL